MENKKLTKFDIDIEIKDLLWEFIRKWRLIIVMALVCGIGLAAYQYRLDMNKTDVVTVKKTQEELEKAMGEQDLDEVTAAVALKRQLDEKSAYMETSELMHINPYEENVVYLQYYVRADSEIMAADVTDVYASYIQKSHLSELVGVWEEDGNLYLNSEKNTDNTNITITGKDADRSFVVKVAGVTPESASALAEEVKTVLQNYSVTLQTKMGEHQIQLLDETQSVIVDKELAELQNWNATAIKTISNNLDSMKNEMTSDQISLYVYRTTVVVEETAGTNNTVANTKNVTISVKHAVIGVVVGVILACTIIFALYLFAAALRNGNEVKTLYNVKVLGNIDVSEFQKKKLFGFVDGIIVKLQNLRKVKLSYEQEIQMACANIVLDCQKNDRKEIVLTSSIGNKLPEMVVKTIIEKCEEKGVHVVTVGAVNYDANALEVLARIGNVVFVEVERKSLYDELYSEISLCKENDINVLGMVVIGA